MLKIMGSVAQMVCIDLPYVPFIGALLCRMAAPTAYPAGQNRLKENTADLCLTGLPVAADPSAGLALAIRIRSILIALGHMAHQLMPTIKKRPLKGL
jgi:hypothetical protein